MSIENPSPIRGTADISRSITLTIWKPRNFSTKRVQRADASQIINLEPCCLVITGACKTEICSLHLSTIPSSIFTTRYKFRACLPNPLRHLKMFENSAISNTRLGNSRRQYRYTNELQSWLRQTRHHCPTYLHLYMSWLTTKAVTQHAIQPLLCWRTLRKMRLRSRSYTSAR